MAGFDAIPLPPAPHEAVRALVALLNADAELQTAQRLGGASRAYAQRQPEPDARPARFVLVRVPVLPSGLPEGTTRAVRLPLQVMVETRPDAAGGYTDDVDGLHAAVHHRIHALLAGAAPELGHGRIAEPVEREGAPSAVAYDAADRAHYSTAEYACTLAPSGLHLAEA